MTLPCDRSFRDFMAMHSDMLDAAKAEPKEDVPCQTTATDADREAFRQALADLGHAEATVFGHWALAAYDKVFAPELYAAAAARVESAIKLTIVEKPADVPYVSQVPFPEVDAEVFWISTYFIDVDAVLGMPVWEGSRSKIPFGKPCVEEISLERAIEFNTKFATETWSREYLAELLEARWRVIRGQIHAAELRQIAMDSMRNLPRNPMLIGINWAADGAKIGDELRIRLPADKAD